MDGSTTSFLLFFLRKDSQGQNCFQTQCERRRVIWAECKWKRLTIFNASERTKMRVSLGKCVWLGIPAKRGEMTLKPSKLQDFTWKIYREKRIVPALMSFQSFIFWLIFVLDFQQKLHSTASKTFLKYCYLLLTWFERLRVDCLFLECFIACLWDVSCIESLEESWS